MKKVLQRVAKFLVSDEGPTAVEYAVLLAFIILVCFVAVQSLGSASSSSFQKTADGLGGS